MLVPCIVESAVYRAINKLGFSSVKYQQMMVINEFIRNRDVFVVLRTYWLWENIVFFTNGLRQVISRQSVISCIGCNSINCNHESARVINMMCAKLIT